jgi:hypothetical protein
MSERKREELIEEAVGAYRPRDPRDGRVRALPAWLDLDDAGRVEAFEQAARARVVEAALDAEGLSSTGRAVMARVAPGRGGRR